MAEDADFLFDQGLSRVTRERYQGIWVRYREWCKRWEEVPLPVTHLAWEDVGLEQGKCPKWIRVKIKESKTDRTKQGAFITLHRSRKKICPVAALLKYMVLRGEGQGPFFRYEHGKGLTRRVFVVEVKKALVSQGMDAVGISGHSFRIGAATTAAMNGASDEDVKALGRWKSREYKG